MGYNKVKRYLKAQEYPEGAPVNDKKFLRRFSAKVFLRNGILYKHIHDFTLLHCMDKKEAKKIIEDIHEGIFGTHSSGHTMAKKILRADYYWSTMENDFHHHSRTCHKCQIYADKVHVPPIPLNVITALWPFSCGALTLMSHYLELGEASPTTLV